MAHRHTFNYSAQCGDTLTYRCKCGAEETIPADDQARQLLALHRNQVSHAVWHEFVKEFLNTDKWQDDEALDAWVAANASKGVRCVGVDDSHHSSSVLILIEHRSVAFLPQCAPGGPVTFFLYPGHRDHLIEALQGIKRAAIPLEKAERKAEDKFFRDMAAYFKQARKRK